MRTLLSAALLIALTATAVHGQTVGGNAYGVLLATPLANVCATATIRCEPKRRGTMLLCTSS